MFIFFDKFVVGGFSIGIELLFDNDWILFGNVKCWYDGCYVGVFDFGIYVEFV